MKNKKILPIEIIENGSFSERRLIMYLFGKKGKKEFYKKMKSLKDTVD